MPDRGELEQLMQADASAGGDEDSRGPRRLLGHDRGDSRQRRRKNPADLLSELLGGGE